MTLCVCIYIYGVHVCVYNSDYLDVLICVNLKFVTRFFLIFMFKFAENKYFNITFFCTGKSNYPYQDYRFLSLTRTWLITR